MSDDVSKTDDTPTSGGSTTTDESAAGYAQPPGNTRFKSGKSGNPKGRPRGSRNLGTDLNGLMTETVAVRENGKSRRITRQEAILLSLIEKAIHGDVRAASHLSSLLMKLNPAAPANEPEDVTDDDRTVLANFLHRNTLRLISPANEDEDKLCQ